jgi:hypothetical protein
MSNECGKERYRAHIVFGPEEQLAKEQQREEKEQ